MALSGWSFESGAHHTAAAGPSRHPTTAGRHLKRYRRVHSCLALGAERLVITMCPKMSDSLLVLCVSKTKTQRGGEQQTQVSEPEETLAPK